MHPHALLNTLAKKLKDHQPGDPELLSWLEKNKKALARANNWGLKTRAFIVLPEQLDTTQPEDLGYGTDEWYTAWMEINVDQRLKPKDFGHNLSHSYNLQYFVTAKKNIIANRRFAPWGLIPEFTRDSSHRRCCFVKSNGMRCTAYDVKPVCWYHYKLVAKVPRMNERFLGAITSEPLKKAVESHLNDPNRRSVEVELAIMRACLDAVMMRIQAKQDLTEIAPADLNAMMVVSKQITETVERMVKVENSLGQRMTMDAVLMLVMKIMDTVVNICNPNERQLQLLADEVQNLPMMKCAPPEAIENSKSYGFNVTTGAKMTTQRSKFKEDGAVEVEGFTAEEVTKHREIISKKFEPAAEREKLREAAETKLRNAGLLE